MGNKKLLGEANEPEKASYSVIKFAATEIPAAYKNMLFSKYLRSLQAGNDFFKLILPKSFFHIHEKYFTTLIGRPNAKIRMAVLSDSPDVVLGWALMEPGILHYVWVGGNYRKTGIATALLQEEFHTTTHITKFWLPIWNNKYPKVNFNPYC